MKLVCIFALLLALVAATSSSSNESQDVDADVKRIRIDPALRKALLRALRHLKERQEEESEQLSDSNTTEENFATTILDEILEESTTRDRNTEIKYHTFSADSENSSNGENEIIKTIIITKPRTTLTPPKEDLLTVPDPIKERERENDVDSNQVARSVSSGSSNQFQEDSKGVKVSVVTAVPATSTTSQVTPAVTTTVTPPTTTIKLPTHNSDGENIERVKSEDVKIYQAPLVAAFTVQQDQLGIPRNVIPLLQGPPNKNPVEFGPSTPVAPTVTKVPLTSNRNTSSVTVAPIPLQTQTLEEKTRFLEQQLITLQTQQRIQEQLLRNKILQEQQVILQQQQQLQQQRVRLEEETRLRLQKFEEEQRLFRQQQQQFQQQQQQLKLQQQQQQQQPQQQLFKPFPNQQLPNNLPPQQFQQQLQQQQFQQQQQQHQQQQQQQQFQQQQQQQPKPIPLQQTQQFQFFQELPRNTPAVQFIPSVSLPTKAIPISVELQLPFKEAVNFQSNIPRNPDVEQIKSINPPLQQFPIIPPSPPQLSKQQLLPLKPFQSFNVNPLSPLSIQPQVPFDQQLPHLQRTRVFRHETGTGNFGFNQQSNAPFRPSQPIPIGGFQPLRNDNQLQNLLAQSGITSRSAEDFNIITKVLALNHGIPQSSSQQMFAKLSPEQQQQLLFRKK